MSGWRARRTVRQAWAAMARVMWRCLPHDFAPWETVYRYFAAWQKEGVFDQLNGLLRRLVREAEGRDAMSFRARPVARPTR
ncbi:Transposase OS=Streptomyces aurantiogriseus OX=66870 GN=GCM10010251_24970 PE=4 SV=1 [Streptomyces aurantiogriseus]|uniref:Insertion element IS402-like domain-containing protein n=1 Tax=Streptomyces aurantiogriseus TaxID=66870 RepID=A0A918F7D8_9ACTN|nr:hypothetical protein GCM10010251_24970 [Streptomyces aurantiogriseus]